MTTLLYVESERIPAVYPDNDVMVIARDHGSENAPAVVFVTALQNDTEYLITSAGDTDFESSGFTDGATLAHYGQQETIELPVAAAPPTHQLTLIQVLRGKAAVTICSPHRIKAEFRRRRRGS